MGEHKTRIAHEFPGFSRLVDSFLGQIDVGPAGEPVFLVPDGLAVPEQNDFFHDYPYLPYGGLANIL
jgi:hypothetical protein